MKVALLFFDNDYSFHSNISEWPFDVLPEKGDLASLIEFEEIGFFFENAKKCDFLWGGDLCKYVKKSFDFDTKTGSTYLTLWFTESE